MVTIPQYKNIFLEFLNELLQKKYSEVATWTNCGELTKLWNQCPNNLEACKGRNFLPTLEEFFSEAIQQLEAHHKIDDSVLKDGGLGWRALRLLARRSPHFFTYGTTATNSLPSYLELMVKKIAHEKPGKEVPQEIQNDNELDNILTETDQATDDLKPTYQEEFVDDPVVRPDTKNLTFHQLMYFSRKIAPNWQKLAAKLGYKKEEIEFFEKENPTTAEQARNLLQLWFEDDEDATLENLLYILEGLEMNEAAEAVKSEINLEIS